MYDRLLALNNSPLYILNRAVARGESGDLASALAELESIRNDPEMRHYYLLDCAVGRLHELGSNLASAIEAYSAALTAAARASRGGRCSRRSWPGYCDTPHFCLLPERSGPIRVRNRSERRVDSPI